MGLYTKQKQHADLLDKICAANCELHEHYETERQMKGKTVNVDVAMLSHVYDLIIALAYTHEGYECECGCMNAKHEEAVEALH